MKVLSFLGFALYSSLALAAVGPTLEGLLSLVIYLVVMGLVFWLLWWFVGFVALPEPFNKVARVIIGLVALVLLLYFLLGILGPLPRF